MTHTDTTTDATTMRDHDALHALVRGLGEAWNAKDGQAFAEPFDEEVIYTVWNGIRLEGREAVARAHRDLFAGPYRGSRVEIALERLLPLADDLALVFLRGKVTLPAGAEQPPPTTPLMVVRRQGSSWRIVAFQNTPVLVARAANGPG